MSHNIFFHATVVRCYRRGLHRGKFEWYMLAEEPLQCRKIALAMSAPITSSAIRRLDNPALGSVTARQE
jgi:hypothetical protein